ncbi:MAG: cytochrome C biogenesis protein [Kineosporiaceae bacterium]|nr:cytochrome C biogenesis protein [Kineosporiaceae bacterium]MBK7621200.1 cytochrome C biogenesis protein [Kineosporiaceae bacterium]
MEVPTALVGALVAGALTVLAPCALSLLPVIVGGAVSGAADARAVRRALVITVSLGASVAAFTLLLKASTALIDVPVSAWRWLSGGLLIALGLAELLPDAWSRITVVTGLGSRSAGGLAAAHRRGGLVGAVLTGAALGPVFTSCSPLYAYVVVTVLPAEPVRGLVLLATYVSGLVAVLLLVALLGQRAVRRLRWAADPHSPWRRGLGVLFVVVGVLVVTGLMQDVETWVLDHSPVAPWEIGADIGR